MGYYKNAENKPFFIKNGAGEKLNNIIEKFSLIEIEEKEFNFLLEPTINKVKSLKISQINNLCETTIAGRFLSSALGLEHIYQSERDDQINLMGLVTAGADDLLKCGVVAKEDGTKIETIIWEWKQHTTAQLKRVFEDGTRFKKQQLMKANTLKEKVAAAATVEELELIEW